MKSIELAVGRDKFDEGIKNYFSEWEFKHPYPEDFEKSLEETIGQNLDGYFDLLKKKGSL
jgi:aminopeptidase N